MGQKAKLVYFSLVVRVIVPENASDEDIIASAQVKILDKIHNNELGENLEEIIDDIECPIDI
jgi:hypothetical protein